MKISVSGELGSGKTELCNYLKKKYHYDLKFIGTIQRELAANHNMTLTAFSIYMETHPEIDTLIDDKVQEYGRSEESFVLDSRMAWYFIPNSFKVHLLVNSYVAAERILNHKTRINENYASLEEASKNLRNRKQSEVTRFKEKYGVDINNFLNYNLIVDTTKINPEELADLVQEQIQAKTDPTKGLTIYLAPTNLYPLVNFNQQTLDSEGDSQSILDKGYDNSKPISVIKIDNRYFILDGHKRCSAAIKDALSIVPVEIVNLKADKMADGKSFEAYIKENYSKNYLLSWEKIHGFKFYEYY